MVVFAVVVWVFIIVYLLSLMFNLYFIIGSLFRKDIAKVYDIEGWPSFFFCLIASFIPILNVCLPFIYGEDVNAYLGIKVYKPDSWK